MCCTNTGIFFFFFFAPLFFFFFALPLRLRRWASMPSSGTGSRFRRGPEETSERRETRRPAGKEGRFTVHIYTHHHYQYYNSSSSTVLGPLLEEGKQIYKTLRALALENLSLLLSSVSPLPSPLVVSPKKDVKKTQSRRGFLSGGDVGSGTPSVGGGPEVAGAASLKKKSSEKNANYNWTETG